MLDEEEKEQVETQLANDAADGEAASSQPSKAGGIRQWCADNKKPFAAIIMLSVLLVASIAAGCIVYTAEHNALASVNEECAELRVDLDEANAKIASLQKSNKELEGKLSSAEKERDSFKAEVGGYQDQQATIADEKAKLEDLHAQLDALQAERDSLQEQIDAKKLAEEKAAQEKEQRRIEKESKSAGNSQIVYWMSGGKVYHTTPDCPTLKRSSGIHSGSISASGKSRCCKVCG